VRTRGSTIELVFESVRVRVSSATWTEDDEDVASRGAFDDEGRARVRERA